MSDLISLKTGTNLPWPSARTVLDRFWFIRIRLAPNTGPKPAPEARSGDRKHYRCLRNKGPSKPYEFIGLGAMDATKPYKFIWLGDIHDPKPYKFIGFRWPFISQTPVHAKAGTTLKLTGDRDSGRRGRPDLAKRERERASARER